MDDDMLMDELLDELMEDLIDDVAQLSDTSANIITNDFLDEFNNYK